MLFKHFEKRQCDVLVIGGGGAGLRASIAAASRGADVLMVSKARIGHATNTYLSKAIIASSGWGDSSDNNNIHGTDTIRGGRYLNDPDMVDQFSRTIPAEAALLREWGVRFVSDDKGKPAVIKIPGHSFARHLVGENWRGSDLVLPLKRKAAASGVRFLEKMKVTSLLVSGSSVRGAACISEDGNFTAISAGAVILATGGFGRLFQNTNNAPGITGDGHALAAMAGATLQDMEFVQYYPTCLGNRGSRLLLYEKILAQDGVVLRNSRGEDILAKNGYDVSGNVTRDQLARVIMKEILEDPERRGSVDMDLGGMSPEAADALSTLLPTQWSEGVRKFQVTPTAHFCMGGVKVDSHGETAVTGLFAAGEVTAGAHGANRLGGNALAEAIAMGSLVGSAAAAAAGKAPAETGDESAAKEEQQRLESLFKTVGADPRDLIRDLKEVMWLNAGIIRDRQSLDRALERIVDWKDMAQVVQTPADLIRCLELGNMLLVGEMVCRSAIERTESRGAHFRSDYPQENDDSWLVNIQIRKAASGLVLERVPVPDNGGTR